MVHIRTQGVDDLRKVVEKAIERHPSRTLTITEAFSKITPICTNPLDRAALFLGYLDAQMEQYKQEGKTTDDRRIREGNQERYFELKITRREFLGYFPEVIEYDLSKSPEFRRRIEAEIAKS